MVYSANGTLVKEIKERKFEAGSNNVSFQKKLPNGIYVIEIRGKGIAVSRKFIIKE